MTRSKLTVLGKTRMVDFAKEEYEKAKVDVPAPLKNKRADLIAEHKSLSGKTAELRKLLEDGELLAKLKASNSFNLDYLGAHHNVTLENVEDLFKFARFQFDAGNYAQAGEFLTVFRVLVPESHPDLVGALWGKLASEILLQDWVNAQDDLMRLKETIDGTGLGDNAVLKLTHRT